MSIYEYVRWIFNLPENSNFSFEDDSNDDGLADNLTDISGTHSITYEGLRFHIQQTGGEFYLEQTISVTTNYRIYFDYKVIGTVNVKVKRYNSSSQLIDTWQDENLTSTSWTYKQYAYTANASVVKLRIYFSCESGSTLYLDNLAIVENATNVLINPTECEYRVISKAEEIENIDNNIQFIKPYKNKYSIQGFSPIWGWVTYSQKAELDALIDEKILIRTHDRQSFTFLVKSVSYGYQPKDYELDQKYSCRIEVIYF